MPPIVLKIKGNESFLPFSNLDQDELSKTWRVCTKVKDSLENGSRLENLSWRLWFIQNVLVSNDVKSKTKFQKWSTNTTRKMENEQELEPTLPINNANTFLSQQPTKEEEPQSVLDYSLDEIKPVGTENFILNQFTSDQEGDQMIELKDIFPFGMQDDFTYTVPEMHPVSDTQINNNSSSFPYNNNVATNTSSWQPHNINEQQTSPFYDNSNQHYPSTVPSYTPIVSPAASPYPNNNNGYIEHDFLADPISGIHSLFADHIDLPAMNIPADNNDKDMMNQLQQQQQSNLVVDFNNAAYVAAAAAATAAALTTLPNATLHNKLLATLPRQTLASAERLLSPANNRRPSMISQKQQQHQRMTESLPPNKSSAPMIKKNVPEKQQQQQQHYFSTFQLDTGNKISSPSVKHNTNKYNPDYSNTNNASTHNSPSNNENPPICSNCEATTTPLWRRSADDKILCNACGLYLKLHNVPRPKHLKPSSGKNKDGRSSGNDTDDNEHYGTDSEDKSASQPQQQTICSNCGTNKTPLWRRDIEGASLCNACGLYLKLRNEKRPLSMKTDVIKKRQRTETLIASSSSSTSSSDDQTKKPRYYDQQSLYSSEKGTTLGYRNAASSLPGTGILMMTNTSTSSPSS